MPTKRLDVFNRINIILLRCFFTATKEEYKTKKCNPNIHFHDRSHALIPDMKVKCFVVAELIGGL